MSRDDAAAGDDRLRLLAVWQSRRRELDELVEPLLLHGPAAVGRVEERLGEISVAFRSEEAAFQALAEALALHRAESGGDGPGAPDRGPVGRPADDLGLLRDRAERARVLARSRLHPNLLADLERSWEPEPPEPDPLWNVHPLRRDGDA